MCIFISQRDVAVDFAGVKERGWWQSAIENKNENKYKPTFVR